MCGGHYYEKDTYAQPSRLRGLKGLIKWFSKYNFMAAYIITYQKFSNLDVQFCGWRVWSPCFFHSLGYSRLRPVRLYPRFKQLLFHFRWKFLTCYIIGGGKCKQIYVSIYIYSVFPLHISKLSIVGANHKFVIPFLISGSSKKQVNYSNRPEFEFSSGTH